jgi:prepilin-type N-terminal cleavage/methylation domain-containing protein
VVPVSPSRARAAAGFSLVELLVGLLLGSVVAAAACRVLQAHQRFYRSQAEVLDVEQGLRAVAYVLAAELRPLDARDGDLLAIGRDSVTFRAMRTFGVVCTPPDASGSVVLAEALTFGSRSPDPARDQVLVFADGDAGSGADAWLDFGLAAVSGGARCSDGSPGTALRLSGATTDLVRVMPGAPLRTWERTTYRLYADEEGIAWVGERHFASGAWTAVSPVAGPLRRPDGLVLVYRDSAGAATTEPQAVARVDIVARALSSRPIGIPGRRANGQRYGDSLAVHVALRNN